MSKRLQLLIPESEFEALRTMAQEDGVTVSEWVRQAIRQARRPRGGDDRGRRVAAIEAAHRHAFPTGDIEDVLAEIERGYGDAR